MELWKVIEALEFGSKIESIDVKLFSEAKTFEKWEEFKNSSFYSGVLSEIKASAEKFFHQPIKTLPFSIYKLFEETGSRKEYEFEYFERRERLIAFAALALAYGDQSYIAGLEDIIWAICDEYVWSLPAHVKATSLSDFIENNNSFDSTSGISPTGRKKKQEIDLFSAETAFALAEILHLLEDKLTPIIVYRAKEEIRQRLLEPYCSFNSPFWWETCKMNWGSVCAGSIGIASIYVIKDVQVLAPIIHRVLETMDCYLSGFENDGVCLEGLGYWNYGFGFYVYFAALLKQRTGNRIDLFINEKVRKIALFQQECYLNEDKIISFSDASTTSKFNPGLTQHLKEIISEVKVPDLKYRVGFNDDHCYRWGSFIRNIVWSHDNREEQKFTEETNYFKASQWLVSRKIVSGVKVNFIAKGGNNDEPHNHNDVGNFILNINDDTFITDTGAGEYTKQYFGPERYGIFCNGSQGHNLPIINGQYQQPGIDFAAKILSFDASCDNSKFELDISKAYKTDNLKALNRKFIFEKDLKKLLTLTDNIEFQKAPQNISERFISFLKPINVKQGIVTLKGEKGTLELLYDCNILKCLILKEEFIDHKAEHQEVYTIDLIIMKPEIKNKIEVIFRYLF